MQPRNKKAQIEQPLLPRKHDAESRYSQYEGSSMQRLAPSAAASSRRSNKQQRPLQASTRKRVEQEEAPDYAEYEEPVDAGPRAYQSPRTPIIAPTSPKPKGGGLTKRDDTGADEQATTELELLHLQNEANAAKVGMNKDAYFNLLKTMKDEEVPNYTDQRVDFNEQLNSLKRRTEKDLPFTMTQINDVAYLDQYSLISFEYHCYQNGVSYQKLRLLDQKINKNGILVDAQGKKVQNLLRTQEYHRMLRPHPMSVFNRDGIRNYEDTGEDMIQAQAKLKDEADFLTIDNKLLEDQFTADVNQERKQILEENAKNKTFRDPPQQMVQGILCQYVVNPEGGIMKQMETDVKMGRKFMKPQGGNMSLTRSKDRKLVSITNFEKDNPNKDYFRIYAWSTKIFRQIEVSMRLHFSMNNYYFKNKEFFHELVEVAFCGGGDYVQLIYVQQRERSLQEQQEYELEIHEVIQQKEKKQLNVQPTKGPQLQGIKDSGKRLPSNAMQDQAGKQRVLCVMPRRARKYVFFNAKTGEIVFEWGGIQAPMFCKGKENQEEQIRIYELGILIKENKQDDDPTLMFAFAGDFMDKAVKQNQMVFNWAMVFLEVSMDQLFEKVERSGQHNYLKNAVQQQVSKKLEKDTKYLPYYPFNSSWIEK